MWDLAVTFSQPKPKTSTATAAPGPVRKLKDQLTNAFRAYS